jgi:hypothetical protein
VPKGCQHLLYFLEGGITDPGTYKSGLVMPGEERVAGCSGNHTGQVIEGLKGTEKPRLLNKEDVLCLASSCGLGSRECQPCLQMAELIMAEQNMSA